MYSVGSLSFQLTRPRKARRFGVDSQPSARIISTHAPTQGATRHCVSEYLLCLYINSRAHARRDDIYMGHAINPTTFQLTRPRKARLKLCGKRCNLSFISTHAPTQGATNSFFSPSVRFSFQLTRPRKARPPYTRKLSSMTYFNSRAHARRDTMARIIRLTRNTFQLTRPRKARHHEIMRERLLARFQLTRPRKARPLFCSNSPCFFRFQLTRPRKARLLCNFQFSFNILISTHAPTQGATGIISWNRTRN